MKIQYDIDEIIERYIAQLIPTIDYDLWKEIKNGEDDWNLYDDVYTLLEDFFEECIKNGAKLEITA